jgi:hypothetical protein
MSGPDGRLGRPKSPDRKSRGDQAVGRIARGVPVIQAGQTVYFRYFVTSNRLLVTPIRLFESNGMDCEMSDETPYNSDEPSTRRELISPDQK